MHRLLQDLRFALRTLRKRWAFTLLAIVSIALGIGANTLMFTVIDEVFLQELPIADPHRLLNVSTTDGKAGIRDTLSHLNWKDIGEQNDVFSSFAGYDFAGMSIAPSAPSASEPSIRPGLLVSGNYFTTLGVQPYRGRFFETREDDAPGAFPVAVAHHDFWLEELGGQDAAIGGTVRINGQPFTLIGVTPPAFDGLNIGFEPAVFVPMAMNATIRNNPEFNWYDERRGLFLRGFGRLAEGKSLYDAGANLRVLGSRLEADFPDDNKGRSFVARSLGEMTLFNRDATTRGSALLMAAVGVVLLIACANVAGLLLAQANERRKEIALRLALGVRRWRLVQQLLTESVALAALGGALGIVLAFALRSPVQGVLANSQGLALDLELDSGVLLFSVLLSLATGLLFGLVPALQSSKPELVQSLKDSADSSLPGKRFTARRALVVGQMALAVLALVAAALFLRSFSEALDLELGFETEGVLALGFNVGMQGYGTEEGQLFFERAESTVAAVPGVTEVALAQAAPMQGTFLRSVILEGENPEERTFVQVNNVGPNYFETVGVALEEGRGFANTDREGQVGVVIVNQRMAERFWPGESALGKRFSFFGMDPVEVVGVARDAIYNSPGEDPQPYAYLPLLQNYSTAANVIARVEGDPAAALLVAERELQALEPDLVINARTLQTAVSNSLSGQRTTAALLGAFGAVALILAAIGIYGVMAFAVRRRQREIGIRLALGAEPGSVVGLVLRDGVQLALVGLAAGIGLSFALTRLASQFLYVSATDALAFAGTGTLLLGVSVVACLVPSLRASKVDPIAVLKAE
ncbi:MAG: ABC transporter permease [Acidobacteriota bacterium]